MDNISKNKLIIFLLGTLIIFGANVTNCYGYSGMAEYSLGTGGGSYYNYNNNYNSCYGSYCGNNNYSEKNSINPVPAVYSLSPRSVDSLKVNRTVTLTGANFISKSVVYFNNSYKTTKFIDGEHLVIELDSSDTANVGNYPIFVQNPIPGGGRSNTVLFSVNRSPVSAGSVLGASTKKITSTKKVAQKPIEEDCILASTENKEDSNNNLSANALFGINGFLPSNLMQWLVFGILILLAVILWRKVYITDRDKAKPLKHA